MLQLLSSDKVIKFSAKYGYRGTEREYRVNEKLVCDWRKKNSEWTKLPSSARSCRVGIAPHWP